MEETLLEKGKRLAKEGDFSGALEAFKRAGGADAHFGEAGCLYKLGRPEEAKAAAEECLQMDPTHKPCRELMDRLEAAQPKHHHHSAHPEQTKNSIIGWVILVILIGGIAAAVWVGMGML